MANCSHKFYAKILKNSPSNFKNREIWVNFGWNLGVYKSSFSLHPKLYQFLDIFNYSGHISHKTVIHTGISFKIKAINWYQKFCCKLGLRYSFGLVILAEKPKNCHFWPIFTHFCFSWPYPLAYQNILYTCR